MRRQTWLILVLVSVCFFFTQTWGQEVEKYYQVEIRVTDYNVEMIQQLGLPLDCCDVEEGESGELIFRVPLTKYDLQQLEQSRIDHKILQEDMAIQYQVRALAERPEAVECSKTRAIGMKLGTMGGFYKIEEMEKVLDELYKKYKAKGIITQKKSIGKSYEGRPIYFVKISDNAAKDEDDSEPGVLYTALTHAREPAGMMAVIYYMYYLLENYDSDERVQNIINNRQLYFIPMLNPDGYAYNQKNYPNGGGMCRKNRNGNGVDLNRNFGPKEYWDYPNGGSSTSPWSQTYRGEGPFSEPETKALSEFVEGHKIHIALNYHTYSNLLLYPYGIRNEVAHPMYRTMAKEMTKINKYRYGTPSGLLYAVRGDSDDWFHKSDGNKGTIFAMTPEVGGRGDGFWPSPSRIFPLAEENLEANLLLAEYASKVGN